MGYCIHARMGVPGERIGLASAWLHVCLQGVGGRDFFVGGVVEVGGLSDEAAEAVGLRHQTKRSGGEEGKGRVFYDGAWSGIGLDGRDFGVQGDGGQEEDRSRCEGFHGTDFTLGQDRELHQVGHLAPVRE